MRKKTCTSCFVEFDLETGFYKHAQMADGHLNKCKKCVKSRVNKHREENIDYFRAYDVERLKTNPKRKEQHRNSRIKWRAENPEKYAAQTAVGNAIRDGKIQRGNCAVCNDSNTHAHHEDYTKPFDVIWLCPLHHAARHKEKRSD